MFHKLQTRSMLRVPEGAHGPYKVFQIAQSLKLQLNFISKSPKKGEKNIQLLTHTYYAKESTCILNNRFPPPKLDILIIL